MTKFIKSNTSYILVLVGIIFLYFILRLPNLTFQPIFADEAIYIRWAQVMKAEPTLRFMSLSDGKTPLFMWIMTGMFKIFKDPLLAGRLLSVISGFITLLGALFLGWKFFNAKAGLWSALLVAITPYIFFFDRMALVDSMLSAFTIWSLNLALLLVVYRRTDLAMLLGYILGGGWLVKTPGSFNLYVLPSVLVAFNWTKKDRQRRLLKTIGLLLISVSIALFIYNLLRLGPDFGSLNKRNKDYIFSPTELIGRPFDPFIPHTKDLIDWLPKLMSVPILIMVFLGIVLSFIKKNRYAFVILLWAMGPLIVQMFLLRTFTARYLLFSIPPLLCLAGWGISVISQRFKVKYSSLFILLLILPLPLYFNRLLMTDLSKIPLPKEERSGYLEEWTAGYGLPEIADFLIEQAQHGTIVVGTEGRFGTLPDGLQIYLEKHTHNAPKENQILIVGGAATVSAQLLEASVNHPTFFIANKSRFPIATEGLKLIKEFPKVKSSKGQDAILFFRVFPQ